MTQSEGSGDHLIRGVKVEKKAERFARNQIICINLQSYRINIQYNL